MCLIPGLKVLSNNKIWLIFYTQCSKIFYSIMKSFTLVCFSVILGSIGQILLKLGMNQVGKVEVLRLYTVSKK